MLFRLRKYARQRRFDSAIKDILLTAPVPVVSERLTIVSMVAARDLLMYLLSIKAFYRRIGRGRIVAIVDRDELTTIRRTLEKHLPGIEFVVLEDIDTGRCQRGGTWERVLYVVDRSAGEYVIQLDSDTLPTGEDLSEVLDCVELGRSFTMADGNPGIVSLRGTAETAKQIQSDYIGIISERQLDKYPDCDTLRYVRGSSGFAGFAAGAFSRNQLEDFHEVMEGLVGRQRWREWGTEQCASNFAIANSPGAFVLPYPAYSSFFPNGPRSQTKFFHFIGAYRFDEGFFLRKAKAEIVAMLSGTALA